MKTISLELAKQLKENGYPQDTYLEWFDYHGTFSIERHISNEFHGDDDKNYYAAPTAEEILEQMPTRIEDDKWGLQIHKITIGWYIAYRNEQYDLPNWHTEHGESLAEAAGKMWLYLKENNLLGTI